MKSLNKDYKNPDITSEIGKSKKILANINQQIQQIQKQLESISKEEDYKSDCLSKLYDIIGKPNISPSSGNAVWFYNDQFKKLLTNLEIDDYEYFKKLNLDFTLCKDKNVSKLNLTSVNDIQGYYNQVMDNLAILVKLSQSSNNSKEKSDIQENEQGDTENEESDSDSDIDIDIDARLAAIKQRKEIAEKGLRESAEQINKYGKVVTPPLSEDSDTLGALPTQSPTAPFNPMAPPPLLSQTVRPKSVVGPASINQEGGINNLDLIKSLNKLSKSITTFLSSLSEYSNSKISIDTEKEKTLETEIKGNLQTIIDKLLGKIKNLSQKFVDGANYIADGINSGALKTGSKLTSFKRPNGTPIFKKLKSISENIKEQLTPLKDLKLPVPDLSKVSGSVQTFMAVLTDLKTRAAAKLPENTGEKLKEGIKTFSSLIGGMFLGFAAIGYAPIFIGKKIGQTISAKLNPKIVDINCQEQILEKVLDSYQSGYNTAKQIYSKNLVFNEDFMNLLRTRILTDQFSNVDSGYLNKCINLATSYNNLLDFFKNFNEPKQTIAQAEPINVVQGVHVNSSSLPSKNSEPSEPVPPKLEKPEPIFKIIGDQAAEKGKEKYGKEALGLSGGGIFSSSSTSANPFTRLKAILSKLRTSIYNVTNKSFNINQKNYIQGFLNQKETEWNNSQIKTSIGSISSADRELLQKISNNYTSLSQNFYDVRSSLQKIPENIEQLIFKKLTINELERQKLEDKIKKQLADQDDQEKGSKIKNLTEEKARLEKILEVYKQYGYIGLNPLDNDDQIKVVTPDSCGNIVHSDFSGIKGIVQNMIKFKEENEKFNYYLHEFIENQSQANPDVPELPSILGGNNEFNENLNDLKGDKYCLTNALNILLQKEAFSANQDICTNNPNDYFILPQIGPLTKSPTLPIYVDKVKSILDLIGVNSDPLTQNNCSFNNDNPSQLKYLEFLLGLYGFKYQIIGSMSGGAPSLSDTESSLPGSSLPSPIGSSIPSPISTPAPTRTPSPTPSIEDDEPPSGPPINTIFGISGGIVDSNRNVPNTLMPGFILLSESEGKVNYIILTNDAFRPQSSVEDIRSAVKNNYQFRLVPDNLDLESKKYYNEKIDFNKIDASVFNSADNFKEFINNQLDNKGVIPEIKKVIYIYNQNYNDDDSEKRELINLYKNKELLDTETLDTIKSDHSEVGISIDEGKKNIEISDKVKQKEIENIQAQINELIVNKKQINQTIEKNKNIIDELYVELKELQDDKTKYDKEKITIEASNNKNNLSIEENEKSITIIESKISQLQIEIQPESGLSKGVKQGKQEEIKRFNEQLSKIKSDILTAKNNNIDLNSQIKTLDITYKNQVKQYDNNEIKIRKLEEEIEESKSLLPNIESQLTALQSELSNIQSGGSKNRKKSKKREKKYSKSKNIFSRKKHKKVKINKKNKSKKIKKHKQKSNKRGGYGAGDLKIVRPQITTTDAITAFLKEEHMKGNKFLLTNKTIKELLKK
uniref:Uncharacterized protein n=2 Tax=Nucleocytoviricota sp. TaxID=2809609 RepID=A0A9E8G868_9VIRU|nr:hypothetical protein [Nucleocytoviricota sp.]